MSDRHKGADRDLDGFFRAARIAAPEPSEAFLARMGDLAEAAQRAQFAVPPPVRAARKSGLFATLAAALGGWGTLSGMAGGMATAAVAGLWIGLAQAPTMMQAVGLSSVTVQTSEAGESGYLSDADVLALAMIE